MLLTQITSLAKNNKPSFSCFLYQLSAPEDFRKSLTQNKFKHVRRNKQLITNRMESHRKVSFSNAFYIQIINSWKFITTILNKKIQKYMSPETAFTTSTI